mmetsp:Transcript_21440/g.48575  ORF Transcript_21440/g.48575 Transcript_21440/m.48575 type:complete len:180 (-) Transcript_21440:167-706(-)
MLATFNTVRNKFHPNFGSRSSQKKENLPVAELFPCSPELIITRNAVLNDTQFMVPLSQTFPAVEQLQFDKLLHLSNQQNKRFASSVTGICRIVPLQKENQDAMVNVLKQQLLSSLSSLFGVVNELLPNVKEYPYHQVILSLPKLFCSPPKSSVGNVKVLPTREVGVRMWTNTRKPCKDL